MTSYAMFTDPDLTIIANTTSLLGKLIAGAHINVLYCISIITVHALIAHHKIKALVTIAVKNNSV